MARLGSVYLVDQVSRALDAHLEWQSKNQETMFGRLVEWENSCTKWKSFIWIKVNRRVQRHWRCAWSFAAIAHNFSSWHSKRNRSTTSSFAAESGRHLLSNTMHESKRFGDKFQGQNNQHFPSCNQGSDSWWTQYKGTHSTNAFQVKDKTRRQFHCYAHAISPSACIQCYLQQMPRDDTQQSVSWHSRFPVFPWSHFCCYFTGTKQKQHEIFLLGWFNSWQPLHLELHANCQKCSLHRFIEQNWVNLICLQFENNNIAELFKQNFFSWSKTIDLIHFQNISYLICLQFEKNHIAELISKQNFFSWSKTIKLIHFQNISSTKFCQTHSLIQWDSS